MTQVGSVRNDHVLNLVRSARWTQPLLLGTCAALLISACGGGGSSTTVGVDPGGPLDVKLTLLHNNDGESQLISASGAPDFGGVARFATLVDQLRAEAESLDDQGGFTSVPLLVTSGDNTLAGPEFDAGLRNAEAGGRIYDAIALDLIGYDAFALGNHDFDFGPDVLAIFIEDFVTPPFAPFLSANLDFSGESALAALEAADRIAASSVITVSGQQFGIVGATTEELRSISSPRNVSIGSVGPAVQAEVDSLTAQGINKIIFISHLQSVNEDLDLIGTLSGIDIAVAGGGDELLANSGTLLVPGDEGTEFGGYPLTATDATGQSVPVVTTPGEYKYVGRLIVDFDAAGNVIGIDPSSGPVRVSGVAPDGVAADAEIQTQVVDPVSAALDELANNVIATSQVALEGRRSPGIRTEETNLGNLVADALRWQAEQLAAEFNVPVPDVALQNGGGIRNNSLIPAGPFTELDTFDILPFPNFVTVIPNIPRDQFKEILENAVSEVENSGGRFAQVSGFRFTYNPSGTPQEVDDDGNVLAAGNRIIDVTLDNGTVIVSDGVVQSGDDLTIATIDFLARGGDQYPYRDADFNSVGVSYQQALRNYVEEELGGLISTADYPEGGEGRITP